MHSGFERFYGFMSGEADLFHPVIYDNMNRVDLHPGPDYYASTDITDKAIEWVRSQHSLRPGQAIFRLLLRHWNPRPVPGTRDVARPVQGQVRPGLGPGAEGNAGPADQT